MKKLDGETSSMPHLPIILLSLARDFYESTQIFSGVYPTLKEREKKFSICINFFLLSHRRSNLFCGTDVLLVPKGDFLFLHWASNAMRENKNVNEIWCFMELNNSLFYSVFSLQATKEHLKFVQQKFAAA